MNLGIKMIVLSLTYFLAFFSSAITSPLDNGNQQEVDVGSIDTPYNAAALNESKWGWWEPPRRWWPPAAV